MSEAGANARQPFSGRAVAAMLAVGVAAFAGVVALSAYAPELRDGMDGRAHALSRSAVGYAGLAKFLKLTGREVVVSRGRMIGSETTGVTVLTPPETLSTGEARKLLQSSRPRLVVLPKWEVAPDPRHPGWVLKAGLMKPRDPVDVAAAFARGLRDPQDLAEAARTAEAQEKETGVRRRVALMDRRAGVSRPVLHGVGGVFANLEPQELDPIDSFQTLRPPGGKVLLADETGQAVLFALDRNTYVLTEPDLLNNQGLRSRIAAGVDLTVLDYLRGGQGPVVFDVTPNGFSRSRSMLRMALGPPFLGATLIALAAGLLMGAHALVRFGPVLQSSRGLALGKRGLVDNSAALIALAGRRARMGARYADLIRRGVAKTGVRDTAPDRIDAALDRLTPKDQPNFTTLATEAAMAQGEEAAVAAARRLHRWRLEITRERI